MSAAGARRTGGRPQATRDGRPRPGGQRGVYVVEFAVVAAVFLFMVFGAIEVSRLMYTWSALDAITQRGARVAAVCARNDPLIAQYALFGAGGDSPLVPDLDTGNIAVAYLDENGGPAGGARPSYVRVSIVNYNHQMLIPDLIAGYFAPALTANGAFATTRPAESLGRNPDTGQDVCFA